MQSRVSRLLILGIFYAICLCGVSARAQYPGFDAPSAKVSGGGAIDGIVAVSPTIDGGAIPIGATAQVVVRFRNDSGLPLQTGQINLYPSSTVSANVSLNQCEKEALPSGAECAVAVSIKGLQAGSWRVEMLMVHSGKSRLVTATMSGTVDETGDAASKLSSDIESIPEKIDFGALGTSQTMVEPVILRNITSNAIDVMEVTVNAAERSGYKVKSDCKKLLAGQACIAVVTWAPTQKGPATGALVVKHSGATAVTSIPLSGDYSPDAVAHAEAFPNAVPGKGLLVSSQDKVDFGSAVSSSSTITVSLVNVGDSPLKFTNIKLSGSDNGLSMGTEGCAKDLVLEPIEACPLTLTWSPSRVGALLDDVQVIHDGARGVLVIPVRGISENVVSQDQKAIVLSESATQVMGGGDVMGEVKARKKDNEAEDSAEDKREDDAPRQPVSAKKNNINAASALDGLKITSFSQKRAIVNGPGGSRLIYDGEPIMLGGVQWSVDIQKNGIEFSAGEDRVLLLFDRSLSALNRVQGKSSQKSSQSMDLGDGDIQTQTPQQPAENIAENIAAAEMDKPEDR